MCEFNTPTTLGEPLPPIKYKTPNPDIPSMAMRTSSRWYGGDSLYNRVFTPISFISKSGKFSGNTLCFWTAQPPKILACLVSTVYQRLLKILNQRHGSTHTGLHIDLIFKVAALYACTHKDSLIDRFLGMSRKKHYHGPVNRFIYHIFCNSGDNTRFVYNQLLQNNSWLTFRKGTCPRRDKPANGCFRPDRDLYKQIWSDRLSSQRAYQEAIKVWLVPPPRSKDDGDRVPDSLESEDNLSLLSEDLETFDDGEADKWSW